MARSGLTTLTRSEKRRLCRRLLARWPQTWFGPLFRSSEQKCLERKPMIGPIVRPRSAGLLVPSRLSSSGTAPLMTTCRMRDCSLGRSGWVMNSVISVSTAARCLLAKA